MADQLEVLLGIHDRFVNMALSELLRVSHPVTTVATQDDMRNALGIAEQGSSATACKYGVVIMDINLGTPGGYYLESGREVYRYLRPLIETGQVKFTTVSANDLVVEIARSEGIPCIPKMDLFSYIQTF